ncbi:hypothetical protein QYM36_004264, partial [Artemia franciscana]
MFKNESKQTKSHNFWNVTEPEIVDGIVSICVGLNLYSEKVCRGVVAEAIPDFIYMYETDSIDRENVCGLVDQNEYCAIGNITKLEWSLTPLEAQKPPVELLPPRGGGRRIENINNKTNVFFHMRRTQKETAKNTYAATYNFFVFE